MLNRFFKHRKKQIPSIPRFSDPRHQWRRFSGNPLMYDVIGSAQFSVMALFFGLRDRHKVLEIGTGSLRAGRFLIHYLDAGCYCGVEPMQDWVRAGLEHEVGLQVADRKRPRFAHGTDFPFASFGEKFDFGLSYSVFTHLPPPQVPIVFEKFAEVCHDDSIFLATAAFCEGDDERIVDHEKWTVLPVNNYSEARLAAAAERAGFRFLRIGKVFQDWFVAFRGENRVALRGAEQMRKVDWPAVMTKWEDPGWDKK